MLNVTYFVGLCYKSKTKMFLIINFINQIKNKTYEKTIFVNTLTKFYNKSTRLK